MEDINHVNLNVGGTHFITSLTTLKKGKTKLSTMFTGAKFHPRDKDGAVFIDRDAKHFNRILNFLRDGEIPLPETKTELEELKREAQFHCMEDSIRICEKETSSIKM